VVVWQDAMRGEREWKREGEALTSARGRVRSRALQRGVGGVGSSGGGSVSGRMEAAVVLGVRFGPSVLR
jgi:hypothetical protein